MHCTLKWLKSHTPFSMNSVMMYMGSSLVTTALRRTSLSCWSDFIKLASMRKASTDILPGFIVFTATFVCLLYVAEKQTVTGFTSILHFHLLVFATCSKCGRNPVGLDLFFLLFFRCSF